MLSLVTSLVGRRILGYTLAILTVISGYFYITSKAYDRGVEQTTQVYEKKIEEERIRIQKANSDSLDKAYDEIERLNSIVDRRDVSIKSIREESASDPKANDRSLGTDSVSRINRIR
jgi:multidrug resistance efflux pump